MKKNPLMKALIQQGYKPIQTDFSKMNNYELEQAARFGIWTYENEKKIEMELKKRGLLDDKFNT